MTTGEAVIRVTAGHPDADELAALVLALTVLTRDRQRSPAPQPPGPVGARAGWERPDRPPVVALAHSWRR